MKIYLSSKGIRPDIDNSGIINNVIAGAKDKDRIVFPNGSYPIHHAIQQNNKGLSWEGAEDSNIVAGLDCEGVIFRTNVSVKSEVERINFINKFATNTKAAITISQVVKISDCDIKDWGAWAVIVSADVITGGQNANSSFSKLEDLFISGCKGGGIYFQGGDANQCFINHCDVRDCTGIAFHDNSFLGNQFFGCMVHNCSGCYSATQDSNRAGFFGCYAEQDSGQVVLHGRSVWVGGFPAGGIDKGGYANVYTASFN